MIINDGLEEIGEWAFYNCGLLWQIVVPPTVQTIKKKAFHQCATLTTTVNFQDGLEEIGASAFRLCTSLQGIVVPPPPRRSSSRPCSMLTTITLHSPQWAGGDWSWGILEMQKPNTHWHPPHREGDQASNIWSLFGVDDYGSWWFSRGDKSGGISTTMALGDFLEEIRVEAFRECASL